jgi:hypothetical protein
LDGFRGTREIENITVYVEYVEKCGRQSEKENIVLINVIHLAQNF